MQQQHVVLKLENCWVLWTLWSPGTWKWDSNLLSSCLHVMWPCLLTIGHLCLSMIVYLLYFQKRGLVDGRQSSYAYCMHTYMNNDLFLYWGEEAWWERAFHWPSALPQRLGSGSHGAHLHLSIVSVLPNSYTIGDFVSLFQLQLECRQVQNRFKVWLIFALEPILWDFTG